MKILNRKYLKYYPKHSSLKNAFLIALGVLLIFTLFQPFGFRDKSFDLKVLLFAGYAFIGFIISILNFYIIRRLLKQRKSWLIKNEIIWFLLMILPVSFIIYLFTVSIAGDMPFNFKWFFTIGLHVFSTYLLISLLEFLYYSNKGAGIVNEEIVKKYKQVSRALSNEVKKKEQLVALTLDSGSLQVNRNKILFIQSVGNYLEIILKEDDNAINKISKRGRIKQSENDLKNFPEFIRCHRAFIVNAKYICKVKGNSKNASIEIEFVSNKIPVSRAKYGSVKELIEQIAIH
jgi:hypothetical protein